MVLRLKARKSRSLPGLQGRPFLFCATRVDAGWSSPVARQAHNLKVVGSNPTPATTNNSAGSPVEPALLFVRFRASEKRTSVAKSPKSSALGIPHRGQHDPVDEAADDLAGLCCRARLVERGCEVFNLLLVERSARRWPVRADSGRSAAVQ